jgi:rhodanese-related sulfurtransferase
MRKRKLIPLHLAILAMLLALFVGTSYAGDIPRMTKEELLKNENAVVVDVRTGRDWKSSEFKIKGASRADKDIVKWAARYPKDTTLVLYCA